MEKEFTITGACIPARHFMADISGKLAQIMAMIHAGRYFIINRPRQYGKTTVLFRLTEMLNQSDGYMAFRTSFEGIGDTVFLSEERFCPNFFMLLARFVQNSDPELAKYLEAKSILIKDMSGLSKAISDLVKSTPKKIVILIDEVDKSSNNQLFVSFLGMLRNKFLDQLEGSDETFHAVVLAGVHDVKTLKLKLRPDAEQKFNSPWNIATDFKVDMNLLPHEIVPMLEEYAAVRGVKLDAPKFAERLHYYTSGYPFLVSKLCKMLDEEFLPEKTEREWTEHDLEITVQQLVREGNANFDSLISNLENYPELSDLVNGILMNGNSVSYNIHNPAVQLGVQFGILRNGDRLHVHNRVYAQLIYNYYISKTETSPQVVAHLTSSPNLVNKNGSLNMEGVLLKFQQFMREQYSRQDRDFLERHGRLVFLAFLKPILNGRGYSFKEAQISEEKRLDVVITFNQFRYLAELKLWRGAEAHEDGLAQLADYLDRQNLEEGFLVIFDHSGVKTWKNEWLEVQGKKVFAIWV